MTNNDMLLDMLVFVCEVREQLEAMSELTGDDVNRQEMALRMLRVLEDELRDLSF